MATSVAPMTIVELDVAEEGDKGAQHSTNDEVATFIVYIEISKFCTLTVLWDQIRHYISFMSSDSIVTSSLQHVWFMDNALMNLKLKLPWSYLYFTRLN